MLVKTTEGYECGAFVSTPWSSKTGWKPDKQAFLFSLTNGFKKYVPENLNKAVFHDRDAGPFIGGMLCIGCWKQKKFLNDYNNSVSETTIPGELTGSIS